MTNEATVPAKKAEPVPGESLIPQDLIVTIGDDEQIAELTKSVDYIPAMRVFDGAATVCKEGVMPPGEIAIYKGNKEFTKLGREVQVLVIGYRPRAAIMQGNAAPINYWDPATKEFQLVLERAKSGNKAFGSYQAGLEYLLFVPDTAQFVCFFMGNKSGRRESGNLKKLSGSAATIKAKYVKRTENSFWCAEILACTAPFEVPKREVIAKAVEIFNSPTGAKSEDKGEDEDTRAT